MKKKKKGIQKVKKIEKPSKLYQFAIGCLERRWSIIPLKPRTKIPFLDIWKMYQTRLPTEQELKNWFYDTNNNIGIVTGKISNITVVDLDDEEAIAFAKRNGFFDNTPRVKTTDGYHLYFKYEAKVTKNYQGVGSLRKLDIKNDGGYVVSPPSIHDESGRKYLWVKNRNPNTQEITKFPKILLDIISSSNQTLDDLLKNGTVEGNRNNAAARVAGHFAGKGLTLAECISKVENWNEKNTPPLPQEEIKTVVKSIYNKHQEEGKKSKKISKAGQALQLLSNQGGNFLKDSETFFKDEIGDAHAHILIGKHFETIPINSKRFKLLLSEISYRHSGCILSEKDQKELISILNSRALFDSPTIPLSYRVAERENEIWIDLGDDQHNAVRITSEGWEVIPSMEAPILFTRYSHMKSLPIPSRNGDINLLRKLIHVPNEDLWILLKVWLIIAFLPKIPRPPLVVHGLQGAGKSIAGKLLRSLIDPSATVLLSLPNNQDDLLRQLNRNYAIVLDNLRYLKDWQSDTICRAITGTASTKRQLYTDDDEIIYHMKRLFILNGINNPASASDLLDRSILIELSRISKEDRKTEQEIVTYFEKIKPKVFGAILDALSSTLEMVDEYEDAIEELPRMADWAKYGYVAAEQLKIGGEEFLEAYERNTKLQHFEVVNNDPVAATVKKLAEQKKSYTGTPSNLYQECKALINEDEIRSRAWPKDAAHFSRRLKLASNNLLELGIVAEWSRGSERKISIKMKQ